MAEYIIVTPYIKPYADVRVPVAVRIDYKEMTRWERRDTFITTLKSCRNVWELTNFCTLYGACSYTYLSNFVSQKCLDSDFKQSWGTLLGEEEFRKLMASQVAKCYKKEETVKEKLEALEDFMNMRLGKMRYPAIVDCEERDYLCRIPHKLKTPKYRYRPVTVHLLDDRFCLETDINVAIFLPYDPEEIDVESVARELDIYKFYFYFFIKKADDMKTEPGEPADSRFEDAVKIANYVILLLEMLKR